MPSIEVSQQLYDFLVEQARHGHDGCVHDYLYSHFGLRAIPETNGDRTILALLDRPGFAIGRTAREQYLMVLESLNAIDPVRFATLNGFRMPNSKVVLISNERAVIERSTTQRTIDQIPGTNFVCLLGASKVDFQDQTFHLMRALHYPVTVAQQVKRALSDPPIDISKLLGL